jgi:hypothetical protein
MNAFDIPPRGRRYRDRARRELHEGERTHWYWRPAGTVWHDAKLRALAAIEGYVWGTTQARESLTVSRWRQRLQDMHWW